MPSNAYSLSQHIAYCQQLMDAHGDLDCVLISPQLGAVVALDGRNVNIAGEALGQVLAEPVVLFGAWRDQAGRLTNQPGAAYQTTAVQGDWRRDFQNAPEDTDVDVWKRYGGQDRAYRIGEKWFVFEGAAERPVRPIEIVPMGLLRWKLPA
jgi:hypothetical protein